MSEEVAWSVMAGAAAPELVPPGDFELAVGGGIAWTGHHRAVCPTFEALTASEETDSSASEPGDSSLRRTTLRFGVGLGRRLGEERIRGAAFLFPHLRIYRTDTTFGDVEFDETRREAWVEGGLSLRGERLWGLGALSLQVANYSPGEDVLDGSLRFAAGIAF